MFLSFFSLGCCSSAGLAKEQGEKMGDRWYGKRGIEMDWSLRIQKEDVHKHHCYEFGFTSSLGSL